jgi:hypothetical protein
MPSPTGSGSVYDLKERYAGRMIPVDANLCLDDDCTASTSSASTSTKRSASECVSDEPERCVLSRSSSSLCSSSSSSSIDTSALDLLATVAVEMEVQSAAAHSWETNLHHASPSACFPTTKVRSARRAILKENRCVAPTQCHAY